jgi:hypothetical protein
MVALKPIIKRVNFAVYTQYMTKKSFLFFLTPLLFVACFSVERDCKPFQTGSFSFTTVVNGDTLVSTFERDEHIEIDYYAGIADTSRVHWINDCECIVKKLNPKSFQDSKAVQMKILSTFEDGYVFEYHLVGNRSNIQRGRVKKISD